VSNPISKNASDSSVKSDEKNFEEMKKRKCHELMTHPLIFSNILIKELNLPANPDRRKRT